MAKQLLHLVIGGELVDLEGTEFRDAAKVHVVGVYPNFATARDAWKSAAQSTVDNAHMRYFVVHLHRLMDPETEPSADHEDTHGVPAPVPSRSRTAPKKAKPVKAKAKPKAKPARKPVRKATKAKPKRRR